MFNIIFFTELGDFFLRLPNESPRDAGDRFLVTPSSTKLQAPRDSPLALPVARGWHGCMPHMAVLRRLYFMLW